MKKNKYLKQLEKEAIEFLDSIATPKYKNMIPEGSAIYIDGKPIGKTIGDMIYSETQTPCFSWMDNRECATTHDEGPAMAEVCRFSYDTMNNFEEQLSKIEAITMNQKLIEQIKELPGVKTVEPWESHGTYIVVFDPEKVAVECKKKKQFEFVNTQQVKKITTKFDKSVGCIDITDFGYSDKMMFLCKGYNVISFIQYLNKYDLKDEWLEYSLSK